jgi:hypothetical protein
MTIEKQREVIRLWNQLRKLEGPAAEELRIQILECFSEKDKARTRPGARRERRPKHPNRERRREAALAHLHRSLGSAPR